MNPAYNKILSLLIERRMTRREVEGEVGEIGFDLAADGKPNPYPKEAGKGYNQRRMKKEIRRAEKRGAIATTNQEVDKMNVAGVASSVPSRFGGSVLKRLGGLGALLMRSRKGGRGQNIFGMAKKMRDDPDQFPSPVRFSPDPNHPNKDAAKNPTLIGGRTRTAIHRLVHGKPQAQLELPSQRYAGSAERMKKFIASGGYDKLKAKLAAQGKKPRGMDTRLLRTN